MVVVVVVVMDGKRSNRMVSSLVFGTAHRPHWAGLRWGLLSLCSAAAASMREQRKRQRPFPHPSPCSRLSPCCVGGWYRQWWARRNGGRRVLMMAMG